MAKIVYNKQLTKKHSGRSPLRGKTDRAVLQLPPMNLGNLKKLMEENESGLPFDEVKKKLDEAIDFTRKQEKEKYEAKIRELESQLLMPQSFEEKADETKSKIDNLKIKLEERDEIIKNLSMNYVQNVEELKAKIDDIANRISLGKYPVLDEDRPELKADIFIDPLDKGAGIELDPHIDEAFIINADRNVVDDLAKLKNILNKGSNKPVKKVDK